MTGRALVRTRRGRTHMGTATLDDSGTVTMPDAQLRHRDVVGVRLYDPAPRSWSRGEWAEVRWLGAAREKVAA